MKTMKVLKEKNRISEDRHDNWGDVIAKRIGKYTRVVKERQLYEEIVFLIASSKLSIPYVIQALQEVLINGEWLANKKEDNMYGLADNHFTVCRITTDSHSANVSTFSNILNKYGNRDFSISHPNNHSNCT